LPNVLPLLGFEEFRESSQLRHQLSILSAQHGILDLKLKT